MPALLAFIRGLITYGGTAATGWAVSDWFNESKKAEQANGQAPEVKSWLQKNWIYFALIMLITGAVVMGFKWIVSKLK